MSTMKNIFVDKNLELSLEFDTYLIKHPELFRKIPKGAYVVITIKDDKEFNEQSLSVIRDPKRKKIVEAQKSGSRWSINPLQPQTA